MLKFVERPTFRARVVLCTAHTAGDFSAVFLALPASRLKELEQQAAAEGKGPQEILRHVCQEVGDAFMPDGRPASVEWLLDQPGVGPAMVATYYRGLWEEAKGNSAPPPAGC